MKKLRTYTASVALLFSFATVLAADSFFWLPEDEAFHTFADPANWKNETTEGVSGIPGEKDRIADKCTPRLDLGGKSFTVRDWHALADWTRWGLYLRNGTLQFDGVINVHGGPMEVQKDGALLLGPESLFIPGNSDAGKRRLEIREGGRFEMLPGSTLDIYNFGLTVHTGGVASLAYGTLRFSHGSQHSYIDNYGTLFLPHGFLLEKGSKGASVTIRQKDGVLHLAGHISTNTFPTKINVELSGGTIRTTGDTDFSVHQLLLVKGATLTLETQENTLLDFTTLKQEADSTLLKHGKGTLALGRVLPQNLRIEEGSLGLYESGSVEGLSRVAFGNGCGIRFGAEKIVLSEAPDSPCSYSIDLSRYPTGAAIVTCADTSLRTKIRTDLQSSLPFDLRISEEGDTLFLVSRFVVSRPGMYDWNNRRTWPGHTIPEKANTTISGKGVIVRIVEKIPPEQSILVADGATLSVETSIRLPKIILRGDARLILGKKGGKTASIQILDGLILEEKDGLKPKILLQENASLLLPEGKVDLSAAETRMPGVLKWKSEKPLRTWTDAVNRSFYISADEIDKNAVSYRYAHPDFSDLKKTDFSSLSVVRTRRVPIYHSRLKKNDSTPFPVSIEVTKADGTILVQDATVTPRIAPVGKPFPNHEILVGHTLYGTNWVFRDSMITNELCNLVAVWGDARRLLSSTMSPAVLEKSEKDRFHYMTIYGYASKETVETLKKEHGSRYLFDNIGEYAGYLYTWAKGKNDQPYRDVIELKDRFVEDWMQKAYHRSHKTQDFMFSTSGSAVANYELEGGVEFICNELYAVGAHNLAYASSEARGAARRWGPEFWCSWLAAEWQTFGVPYHSVQKYSLLLAGFLQQYLMGTSIMVLESGAQGTQAHEYTTRQEKVKEEYDDYSPVRYRETTKEFFDFIRKHPRAEGTPETNIAFLLGNGDAYIGNDDPHYAVWAAQSDAGTNTNWRYCAPEHLWNRTKELFFPLCSGSLAPHPNGWLAGAPYGQCDIVCVDQNARYSDISRYKFASMIGWNTATPEAMAVLDHYVRMGGHLLMAIPHASTRVDREHTLYLREDLIEPYRSAVQEKVMAKGDLIFSQKGHTLIPALVDALKNVSISTEIPVAKLTPQERSKWEILLTLGENPLLLTRREGKGRRYLFLSWEYPGNKPLIDVFGAVLTSLADAVPQTLVMRDADETRKNDRKFICNAVYGNTAYILNMDCNNARAVKLRTAGFEKTVELSPCSLYQMDLRDGSIRKIFDGPSSKTFNPPAG